MHSNLTHLLLLLTASAALSCAQTGTATLRGTVTDSNGAPVKGVTLTLTEAEKEAAARQFTTQAGGGYEAAFLKPGTYRLSIEEEPVAEGVRLEPGEVLRLDVQLPPETSKKTATVRMSPAPVQSETAAIANTLDYKARWKDAPAEEMHPSVLPLLATAPAVQGNGRGLVISGVSSRQQQTWAVDGTPYDSTSQTGNPAFFEMVQATIANAGVESARPVSFNMVSKSAGDTIHGSFFYKRGSSAFDARSYFDTVKPGYKINDAEGELSGPLIRKWTYVYAGGMYQKTPYRRTMYADVPTEAMRSLDFSAFLNAATAPGGKAVVVRDPRNGQPFPGNTIPASRLNAVSSKYLGYYPNANTGDAGGFTQNYTWRDSFGDDAYVGNWPFARLDQRMWTGNQLYVRWMQNQTATVAQGSVGGQLASTQTARYRGFVIADVQTFSSSLVNRFQAGRTKIRVKQGEGEGAGEAEVNPLRGDSVVSNLGLKGVNPNSYSTMGFPSVSIAGLSGLSMVYSGGNDKDVAADDGIVNFEDGVTWSHGRHSVKAGVQHLRLSWRDTTVPQTVYGAYTFTGAFTGLAFADFALGIPATSTRQTARLDRLLEQNQTGLYLADSFRVTPRLTLDYGLRWDYYGSPVYDDGYMSNWDPATGSVVVAPGTRTSVSAYYPKSITVVTGDVAPKAKKTNLRPRVSAAFRLTDWAVLRGGYGEFTENPGYGLMGRVSATNPFDLTETYTNSISGYTPALSFPNPYPASPSSSQLPGQNVTAFPLETDEGVIRQYNATVDASVWGWGLRASYIGSRGTGMNYVLDINKPRASTTAFTNARKPYPQFASTYVVRTDGEWHYDSGVLQVQRRTGPVTLDSSVTWANNVSNYANTTDPYNVTSQWTRDGANRRLYFVTSAGWDLPLGKGRRFLSHSGPWMNLLASDWRVQAISTFASGQYYSPLFTGADPANASAGYVTQLPDCVGDPNAGARTKGQWFNPAAFAVPAANSGRYGTCGMNVLEGYPIHVAHVSVAKSIPLGEQARLVFTTQISNVTNTPHFTVPVNNISNANAGVFTASSLADAAGAEKPGYRQIDFKLRLQW